MEPILPVLVHLSAMNKFYRSWTHLHIYNKKLDKWEISG